MRVGPPRGIVGGLTAPGSAGRVRNAGGLARRRAALRRRGPGHGRPDRAKPAAGRAGAHAHSGRGGDGGSPARRPSQLGPRPPPPRRSFDVLATTSQPLSIEHLSRGRWPPRNASLSWIWARRDGSRGLVSGAPAPGMAGRQATRAPPPDAAGAKPRGAIHRARRRGNRRATALAGGEKAGPLQASSRDRGSFQVRRGVGETGTAGFARLSVATPRGSLRLEGCPGLLPPIVSATRAAAPTRGRRAPRSSAPGNATAKAGAHGPAFFRAEPSFHPACGRGIGARRPTVVLGRRRAEGAVVDRPELAPSEQTAVHEPPQEKQGRRAPVRGSHKGAVGSGSRARPTRATRD